MNKKIFDDLQTKLGQIIENSPAKDIERNIRAMLTQALSKLELVTNEEFEVQKLLMAQMQHKISTLEKRLGDLELQMKHRRDVHLSDAKEQK